MVFKLTIEKKQRTLFRTKHIGLQVFISPSYTESSEANHSQQKSQSDRMQEDSQRSNT